MKKANVYFGKLSHQKMPVEMHIYPKGDYGFILSHPQDGWNLYLIG